MKQIAPFTAYANKLFKTIASGVLVTIPLHASANPLDLSDIPLEVKEGVPANIILTMDDSGSMAWAYLPDSLWSRRNTNRFKSSTFNVMYYNPEITYLPGVDQNGNSLGNSTFTAAWLNGYVKTLGTVDLSSDYQATARDYRPTTSDTTYVGPVGAAYYYVFDSSRTTGGTACDINNTAHVNNSDDCYRRVIVSATSGVNRYSPEATGCSPASTSNSSCYTGTDERRNFANWYSYYRIRHLLAKTATTRAFSGLSNNIRIAWQTLNRDRSIGNPLPFSGTHRESFFNWLYTAPTSGSTPLTDAFWRAGGKFTNAAPYRKDPNDSSSPEYGCRQNFHFAFTDGYWNNPRSKDYYNVGNYDARSSITLPNSSASAYGDINYDGSETRLRPNATPPIYNDGNSNFLADIALYYWATDLRPYLENTVPHFISDNTTDIDNDGDVDNFDIFWNPNNDPAEWQHMVNFTVGLGIDGVLAYNNTTYNQLLLGPDGGGIDWPTCSFTGWSETCHVDDLWHAAINSRGRYFSASNPQELMNGFQNVLAAIDDRKGSNTTVATTSSQYQAGTIMFKAIYDPSKWEGDIIASDIISGALQWSAAERLENLIQSGSDRTILTLDPTIDTATNTYMGGIPFQWSDLTTGQQSELDKLNGTTDGRGQLRLNWLRGDDSNEQRNGGPFRNRSSYLGDVVHSDPIFVPPPGPPLYYYPDDLESVAYSSYVSSNSGRTPMLIFGSNDGMVHILNANNGNEILAYIPSPLYKKLSKLTDPDYAHEFYIDQPVSVWDVFFENTWHTVAIGGLGKGGQGIYALDISKPSSFTESNAENIVLWEFTDANDPDLGYTYTKPYIMKMNNDKWMVAFSNGYNADEADGNASTEGDAILFIVDVANGGMGANGILAKLSTQTGMAEDPTGQNRANRLSDITAVDVNSDYKVDYIYAGDLFGNLWKFDVTDTNPSNWDVVKQGNTPKPLFVARDPSGNAQPITLAPAVQYHPRKHGYLVFFGTGKYVENNDPADTALQTFYAVWDRQESSITTIQRKHLLKQQMLGENLTQFTENDARLTTDNTMNWYNGGGLPAGNTPTEYLGWYIDLANIDSAGDPILTGERIDGEIYVFGNRVEFQTLVPSTDPCVSGGESWLFALNATTGSRFLTASPWDYNNDGAFGTADRVNFAGATMWGSGIRKSSQGAGKMFRRTKLLVPSECKEVNILNMADGSNGTITGNCLVRELGRRSWRQIQISN